MILVKAHLMDFFKSLEIIFPTDVSYLERKLFIIAVCFLVTVIIVGGALNAFWFLLIPFAFFLFYYLFEEIDVVLGT